jgi:hypothetical protein
MPHCQPHSRHAPRAIGVNIQNPIVIPSAALVILSAALVILSAAKDLASCRQIPSLPRHDARRSKYAVGRAQAILGRHLGHLVPNVTDGRTGLTAIPRQNRQNRRATRQPHAGAVCSGSQTGKFRQATA